jgi:hypothetical protein
MAHRIDPTETNGSLPSLYLTQLGREAVLNIETQYHSYKVVYLGHGAAWISGHPEICPEPRLVNVLGSVCDGSTLTKNFIGEGTQLAFQEPGRTGAVVTSPIEAILVRQWGNASLVRRALGWLGQKKSDRSNRRPEHQQTAVVIVESRAPRKKDSAGPSRSKARIAGSCRALRHLLDRRPSVKLVITEATLPDGNWCTVLKELIGRGSVAKVIVCSRRPNPALRQEALQRGASYAVGNPESVAAIFSPVEPSTNCLLVPRQERNA